MHMPIVLRSTFLIRESELLHQIDTLKELLENADSRVKDLNLALHLARERYKALQNDHTKRSMDLAELKRTGRAINEDR